MELYHLSHTDLDGYSCQVVTKYFFENANYYNANYGAEVGIRLKQIEEDIKLSKSKEILILITDLNISKDECKFIDQAVSRFQFLGKNVKLLLLDHHITGQLFAKKYDWYNLDTNRCATKITWDYFNQNNKPIKILPEELSTYVDAVNAYDLWNEDTPLFEFGKVLNRFCVDSKEINNVMFAKENAQYKQYMLESSFKYLVKNDYISYDDNIVQIKKAYLSTMKDSMDNLISKFIVELLNNNKDQFTIYFGSYKALLTTQIGNTSVLGNAFLKANSDFDFFIDVGITGNVSLRADGKLNVGEMSANLFNGGGHPNAAGGKILGIKEAYVYTKLKEQVQNWIDEKSSKFV